MVLFEQVQVPQRVQRKGRRKRIASGDAEAVGVLQELLGLGELLDEDIGVAERAEDRRPERMFPGSARQPKRLLQFVDRLPVVAQRLVAGREMKEDRDAVSRRSRFGQAPFLRHAGRDRLPEISLLHRDLHAAAPDTGRCVIGRARRAAQKQQDQAERRRRFVSLVRS